MTVSVTPGGDGSRRAAWVVLAVLLAAFAQNAALEWGTWGDVAGDTGRELELARLLATGRRLYVDVAYYYGPLAPHLNALLFRTFGPSLGVLVAAGLVTTALACGGVVAIVWRLAGALAAALAGVAFLYCCGFAHLHYANVFNWVLPYGFAATYGMLAAIWSVERLIAYVESERPSALIASALLLAAAGLAKAEPAIAALPAHATVAVARVAGAGIPVATALRAYGAAALLLVIGYAATLGTDPVARVRENFVDVLSHPAMRGFLRTYSGLADPIGAAWTMARSAAVLGAAVLATGAAGMAVRERWLPRGVAAAIGVIACIALYLPTDPGVPFAVLPIVAVVALVMLGWTTVTGAPAARRATHAELALWAAALGCLARMPLAAGARHYGFYLLPLPLAAFVVWWFRRLPAWLGPRWSDARAHAAIGVGLVMAIAAAHLRVSAPLAADHTIRVVAPRGSAWLLGRIGDFPLGRAYADTIRHLATYPATTRVLVVPTGSAMPFLAGLESAGDRTGFVPAELPPAAEDRLLVALADAPPDLVVSLRLDLREWGSQGFGVDYGRRTWAWIRAHYEPVTTFGPEALVLVLRRRDRRADFLDPPRASQ